MSFPVKENMAGDETPMTELLGIKDNNFKINFIIRLSVDRSIYFVVH